MIAQHSHELRHSVLYDEIVTSLLEHHEIGVSEIIQIQLQALQRSPRLSSRQFQFDPMLHMGADQYAVFSVLSSSFDQLRNNSSHRLFFVTGSGGVGKSFMLSAVENNLNMRRLSYLKLAPTGIAAINIEGETIHSALSITTSNQGNKSTSFMRSVIQSEERQNELEKYSVLLIDEISMVSAELLNFISSIFSRIHKNGRPFGGVCVIAFGDLLQLPPVVGQTVFKSPLWRQLFPLFLTHSRRQEGQPELVQLLNEVRVGQISAKSWNISASIHQSYSIASSLYQSTFIISYRKAAQDLNRLVLSSIDSPCKVQYAIDREGATLLEVEQSSKSFKAFTNLPEEIDIRIGARVMFLDNSLIELGISNGSIGVIIEYNEEGQPKVAFPTMAGIEVHYAL